MLLCAPLAACGGGSGGPAGVAARTPVTARLVDCPVTIPNGGQPPGEQQSPDYHGNGSIWTALPPDGKIVATRPFVLPDGSMRIKFPWWGSRGAGAHLTVSGSGIGRPGGLARATVTEGLTAAPHFWASSIVFPTGGCWRVTGTAGPARLTFVVLVVKSPSA
jgi:hypothetical protein